ncbi:MAG: NAD-dependent epimerase/dehydratase family protein [Pusillimonas sp.]
MKNSPTVLLTGSSGFIGATLQAVLQQNNYNVRCLTRMSASTTPGVVHMIADITDSEGLIIACQKVDCVVHLAGRAHQLRDQASSPLAEFRKINVNGTMNLARAALEAGVKRFIFISSIGVNGAFTTEQPFTEDSVPAPHADYAISKLEAEQQLAALLQGTGMELVIIRPPLVYAGHAPGNFHRILKLIAAGMPLPFGAIKNQRSLVALPNLVDFILLCIEKKEAAGQLFLISDGIDVSIQEIVQYLALGMEKKVRILSIPAPVLKLGAQLIMMPHVYTQLCASLIVDSSKARKLLGWNPIIAPQQALYTSGLEFRLAHGN